MMNDIPYNRENRPVADPRRYFDYSEKRLKRRLERMRAVEALADLQAKGVTLTLRNGKLRAGPASLVINGTAQKIEQYREWFVVLLSGVT